MKKNIVVMTAIILVVSFVFTGCGTSNEQDSEVEKEIQQEIKKETEEITEHTKEEIDAIVNDFLLSYQPVESIEVYGFTYIPDEDPYYRQFSYNWCNDIPIITIRCTYKEVNGQAEPISNYVFYYVDKTTGDVVEMQKPDCFEAVEYSYDIYIGENDLIIKKSFYGEDPISYYLETFSQNGFIESAISNEEAESLLGAYELIQEKPIATLTANTGTDKTQILDFLGSYVPDSTFEVFEMKGYPATEYPYREDVGVRYVPFATGEGNVLVVSVPYGKTEGAIYYKLEVYYYDENAKSYILFENQPDTTHDIDGYPTNYNFNVIAQNDGVSNEFILESGVTRVNVKISGTTLSWDTYNMQIAGGNSPILEWQK